VVQELHNVRALKPEASPMSEVFPILLLNARPAAGKSEIIHALQELPVPIRRERFHIGELKVFDDFPMLWNWFEEDQLLEQVFHRPRLHTAPDQYFIHGDLWHLLIRRLALDYANWQRDAAEGCTAIIEFSRGSSQGGYRAAYPHLGEPILSRGSSLYIQVSYAESLRKNRTRFNPDRPDSILEHGLSDEKMDRLYHEDDWAQFSSVDPDYLQVDGLRIPYVTFENEDDVTSLGGEALLERLEAAARRLWGLYLNRAAL
jgi:hypothetical protein